MRPEDDGGWGRAGEIPSNMLYVYRPEGPKERAFAQATGKSHEGRLFLHEICTGNRVSYTTARVNDLLTQPENEEHIKERIVELIPALSPKQKRQLAEGISKTALNVVSHINPEVAAQLKSQQKLLAGGVIATTTSTLSL
jgi:hypothetical protein